MKFNIRTIGKYVDVEVIADDTKISLGLLDKVERLELAKDLKYAIEQLLTQEELQEIFNVEEYNS